MFQLRQGLLLFDLSFSPFELLRLTQQISWHVDRRESCRKNTYSHRWWV